MPRCLALQFWEEVEGGTSQGIGQDLCRFDSRGIKTIMKHTIVEIPYPEDMLIILQTLATLCNIYIILHHHYCHMPKGGGGWLWYWQILQHFHQDC
jgi:hypothetical protein